MPGRPRRRPPDVIGNQPDQGADGPFDMTAPLKSIEGTGDIAAAMGEIGRRARAAARVLALASGEPERPRAGLMAAAIRAQKPQFWPPTPRMSPRRAAPASPAPSSTGWRSTQRGSRPSPPVSRSCAALKDPVGAVTESWTRPNGMTDRARAGAARRHRHHLRKPAERDRRCRRALPEVRQCRDPARRLGQPALQPRHPSPRWPRPARGRPARGRDPAGADARPRRGRADAGRARRQYRRHRAARRQEPGRARAGGSARAGVRASRRRLPCLCRQGGLPRHGQEDRAQRQDAAHRRVRRGRDAAGRSRRAPQPISSRWSRC